MINRARLRKRWEKKYPPLYNLPLDELLDIVDAAFNLYARVEMDESVGICLTDRVPSLRLGEALMKVEDPPEDL